MSDQDPKACFVVIGILMIVAGWFWWWPLFIMGALFLFCGICSMSKAKKRIQTAPIETAPEPVPQPQNPAPPPIIEGHRYCPNCGNKTDSKFCPECGNEIE